MVAAEVRLPATDDTIVLLDPDQRPDGVLPWHPFHNVLRITPEGEVRWRAELLSEETAVKAWLGLDFDGALRVWTWSYNCELDPESGRIVRKTFTK